MIARILKYTCTTLLLLVIISAPLTPALAPQKAEAIFDGGGSLWLVFKEQVLDGIGWKLVDKALGMMIESTTVWINNGFNGKPMYVTNLPEFMTGVADAVAGDVLSSSGLGFLCSPFQVGILAALTVQYRGAKNYNIQQCTLTGAIGNVESFLGGEFGGGGGWDMWKHVTLSSQNNPYGAMLGAEAVLNAKIASALGIQKEELDRARGFLDLKKCEDVFIGPTGKTEEKCTTVTPGAVIETQLNETLGLPGQRLTVADELDEMVGALMTQLIGKVMGGGGLGGVSQTDFNAINAQNDGRYMTVQNAGVDQIVRGESIYVQNQEAVVDAIRGKQFLCEREGKVLSLSLTQKLTTALSNILTSQTSVQNMYTSQTNNDDIATLALIGERSAEATRRELTDITLIRTEINGSGACIESTP